ncbi:hypothetical protein [Sandaracinobacteroides hominis]|uniref:hypothetical protein n=1 Tax=Sandaracinobacteroides hominis TaxID=2780086 RepID=UPI0018F3D5BC|nr:hypothetical protein [Sandaracinobacteroides hominis]
MWRWVLGLLGVLGLALLFLPLSAVATRLAPGLQAEQISGSIWKGRLGDVQPVQQESIADPA